MATILREDPYGPFNFQVTISPLAGGEFRGGFSDCSGLSTEITFAEYREGVDPYNRPRKIPLMYKAGDITLKRGLIAALDLWAWVEQVRKGNMQAKATVVIDLKSEDLTQTVATWTLTNARPSKWTGPTLAAKGASDVAMEELTLICEDISYG